MGTEIVVCPKCLNSGDLVDADTNATIACDCPAGVAMQQRQSDLDFFDAVTQTIVHVSPDAVDVLSQPDFVDDGEPTGFICAWEDFEFYREAQARDGTPICIGESYTTISFGPSLVITVQAEAITVDLPQHEEGEA